MAQSITLQTSDNDIVTSDVLGRLSFAASSESSGSDAVLIGASIYAMAESDFTQISNATSIIFATSTSESAIAKLKISSQGHFLPILDKTYDIGASGTKFRNIYAENGKFENISISNLSDPYEILYITDSSGNVSSTDLLKVDLANSELDLNADIVGTGNINITGNITANSGNLDVLAFNVNDESILTKGQISWEDTEGVLSIGLTDNSIIHIGEHKFFRIRNETGSPLYKGQVVYANGVHSNGLITPSKYVADGTIREVRFMGVILEDVNHNNNGYVVDFGHLHDMDLDGSASNYAVGDETWVAGDILYVHPTVAGKLTKVEPKHSISVAIVLDPGNGNGNGRMFVRPTSYGHLDDNHDVSVSGATNGQYLQYNSSTDYWMPTSTGIFTFLDINGAADFSSTIDAPNLGTGEDNSVVILDSDGKLRTDEIDARVWGSTLVDGTGTASYVTKWSDSNTLTNSIIYDSSSNIGIGTTSPSAKLHISRTYAYAKFCDSFYQSAGFGPREVNDGFCTILYHWGPEANNNYWQQDSSSSYYSVSIVNSGSNSGSLFKIDNAGKVLGYTTSSTNSVIYTFDTDDNTGLGREGSDILTLVAGGSTRVKIGESNRFIVQGNSETYGFGVRYSSGGTPVYFGASANTNPDAIISNAGGAELIRFTNGGNVGIGTSSPSNKVHISSAGNVGLRITSTDTNDTELLLYSGSNGGGIAQSSTSLFLTNLSSGGTIEIGQVGAGNIKFSTNGSERVRIDSTGNLYMYTGQIFADNSTSVSAPVYSFDGDSNTGIGHPAADVLTISTNELERMRITSGGNIGIGTTSPSDKVHISSTGTVALRVTSTDTNGAQLNLYSGSNVGQFAQSSTTLFITNFASGGSIAIAQAGAGAITFTTNSNERARIASDGKITALEVYNTTVGGTNRDLYIDSTGLIGYVSSIRSSKTNIQEINDVNWLNLLKPVSFYYRKKNDDGSYIEDTDGNIDYGLIAEEVESVAPEMCFYDIIDNTPELRGVHYSKLITPMLVYIQQLEKRLKILEEKEI